jgi:hypothetical protein
MHYSTPRTDISGYDAYDYLPEGFTAISHKASSWTPAAVSIIHKGPNRTFSTHMYVGNNNEAVDLAKKIQKDEISPNDKEHQRDYLPPDEEFLRQTTSNQDIT